MTKRFLVAVAAPFLCFAACDDAPESHQYIAMLYEPGATDGALGCLEPSVALDVVPGEDGNMLCAPACLVASTSGGGSQIYVSTMCAPYPGALDTTGTDPGCPGALAAWQAYAADGCHCGECAGDGGGDDGGGDDGAGDDGSGDDGGGDDGAGDDGSGDDAPTGDDAADGASPSDGGAG
jgi:hypothetical protein